MKNQFDIEDNQPAQKLRTLDFVEDGEKYFINGAAIFHDNWYNFSRNIFDI